jgi:hypothetical protein
MTPEAFAAGKLAMEEVGAPMLTPAEESEAAGVVAGAAGERAATEPGEAVDSGSAIEGSVGPRTVPGTCTWEADGVV